MYYRRAFIVSLLIVGVLLSSLTVMAQAPDDIAQLDGLIKASLGQTQRRNQTWATGEIITSDYQFEGDWAFGIAVVKVPEGIHGEPDLRLFLGKRDATGSWQTALEYTEPFYAWMHEIPDTLISFGQKHALQNAGFAYQNRNTLPGGNKPLGNPNARLSLPWKSDTSWMLLGGPHGNNGDSVRPWSALDLNPDFNASAPILAAREGFVYRSNGCRNYVRVDHADGWQTGYYHVINEKVNNGQYIERGAHIGNTSAQTGCGGWASGPHVHFTLKYNGNYININGHDIGGWTVQEGNTGYAGCMVRVRDNLTRCKSTGLVYNEGAIGSGYFDTRYDYNRDNLPDIWVVNQRDTQTNSTSLQIASGSNPNTPLLSQKTGMPQQPETLNTAFAAADYNGDKVPDLWVIHRWDSAGKTAFRVMSGANLNSLIADRITAMPTFEHGVVFAVADYNRDSTPDLWAINPRSNGYVGLQIVNGAQPTQHFVNQNINHPAVSAYDDVQFAAADYNADGLPDLWIINPRDIKQKGVSVRIISGKDWSTTLLNKVTPLPVQSSDITSFSVMVADYNRDSYPDVWLVNRKKSRVQIISGRDMTTQLYEGKTALPTTNNSDWHILGADRSREEIAPQKAKPNRPKKQNSIIHDSQPTMRWKTAGLAERYTLTVFNQAGAVIVSQDYNDIDSICAGKWCTALLPAVLAGSQTYQWTVTAHNRYGSTVSDTALFTTDVPGAPTLITPKSLGEVTPDTVFTWEHRPEAEEYKFVVKNLDKSFKYKAKIGTEICTADVCSLSLPEPLAPDNYMWRVVARKPSIGGKSKSEKRWFHVLHQPTPTATETLPETPTEAPTDAPTETPTDILTETPTPTPTDGLIGLPDQPTHNTE